MRKDLDCFALARLGCRVGRHQVVALHARLRHARIGKGDGPRCHLRGLLWTVARLDLGDALDLAVGLLGELLDLLGGDVAGDDEDRVVRRIEALVELDRIRARELLDLLPPADDRPPIGMVEKERCLHLLRQAGSRIVGDPHVLLFEHDLQFRLHDVVGQHQAGHAVGLEFHQHLEMLARSALEIAGIVRRRERVLLAADVGHRLREQPLRVLLGAFEHQVLEEVRETGLARRLVGGADAIPEHMRDDRRAVIGNDDDLEPVGEREVRDVRSGVGTDHAGKRHRQHGEHSGEGVFQRVWHGRLSAPLPKFVRHRSTP